MSALSRNIVVASGQTWKLVTGLAVMVVAGGAIPWAASSDRGERFIVLAVAPFVGLAGLLFSALSIQCPSCRARWFWRAVSTQPSNG